jgi:DNA-binding NtrC family response regulator
MKLRAGLYRDERMAFEREFWMKVMEFTRWNVTEAAQVANIERSLVYVKLKQCGLIRPKENNR